MWRSKRLWAMGLAAVVSFVQVVSASDKDVAAKVLGDEIKYSDLDKGNRLEIYQAKKKLHELQNAELREILIDKLIAADPRSKGITIDQYISQFVINPVAVTDGQVDAFIKNRRISQDKINTNLKEQARRYLMQLQVGEQIDQWLQVQIKKHNVTINLDEPQEPRFEVDISDSAVRGGKNAKVTIVEFSDFECPYCQKANETLYMLDSIYGDKIKIVYKHFPLSSIHPQAQKAGEASACAQEQGMEKFWIFHDKLFDNYRSLSVGRMKDFAKELGLDAEKFNECLTSGKMANKVARDLQQGLELGVESTPAFFINGRFVRGALPLDNFREIIDQELAR